MSDPPSDQRAFVSGHDNVIVQAMGDGISINLNFPHLTLTRYLARRTKPRSAVEWLSPYGMAVPWVGREAELSALHTWRQSSQQISVRVMTGAGGIGKTRLALKLCDEAVTYHWDAGFATAQELVRFLNLQNVSAWQWQRPTLVVVDYAAARARLLRPWLIELADRTAQDDPPLRLLLVERQASPHYGWWLDAFGLGGGDAIAVSRLLDPSDGPWELRPMATDDRSALLDVARRAAPPSRTVDQAGSATAMSDSRLEGEPLFLLMAAEASGRYGDEAVTANGDRVTLAFDLADRELGRIRSLADANSLPAALMAHMSAYVTLSQGLSQSEAEKAIVEEKKALGFDGAAVPDVYTALRNMLDASSRDRIGGVVPDLIGEALVIRALDALSAEAGAAVVARAASRRRPEVVASVMRTIQDFAPAGLNSPLGWFDELVSNSADDVASLLDLAGGFPTQTLALRQLAANVNRRVASLLESNANDESRFSLAATLNNLSIHVNGLGRHEEAVDAATRAVAIARELTAREYVGAKRLLALALNNLSNFQESLGDRAAALAAITESAAIARDLASSREARAIDDLAMALVNLSVRTRATDRGEEALEYANEAVTLRRHLAAHWPEAFTQGLATALSSRAQVLSMVGASEQAGTDAVEAVSILRALAGDRPDMFRAPFARALHNLSNHWRETGRPREAVEAAEEATAVFRELWQRYPDVFTFTYAVSLTALAGHEQAYGRLADGVAHAMEAVSLCRTLVQRRPAHREQLAQALHNLSLCAREAGLRHDAVSYAEEAVLISRALAAEQPDLFLGPLGESLMALADCQVGAANHPAATTAFEEAVAIFRDAAQRRPRVHAVDFARALNGLAIERRIMGDSPASLRAGETAVAIHRQLQEQTPNAHRDSFAEALSTLATSRHFAGDDRGALEAAEEAVAITRELFAASPEATRPSLAMALSTLALRLADTNRLDDAMKVGSEVVAEYERLAGATPRAYNPLLANAVNNLSTFLARRGDVNGALARNELVVAIRRQLAAAEPRVFALDLARSLVNRAVFLMGDGRPAEAFDAAEEAVRRIAPHYRSSPDEYAPVVGTALRAYTEAARLASREPDQGLFRMFQ